MLTLEGKYLARGRKTPDRYLEIFCNYFLEFSLLVTSTIDMVSKSALLALPPISDDYKGPSVFASVGQLSQKTVEQAGKAHLELHGTVCRWQL